jgi:thioredoxin-like negative regulator of GroEL
MKPVWIILVACITWIGIVAVIRSPSRGGGSSGWQKTLDKALADGKKQNKPVILYFTADWCPPCQEMKKTTWPNADVQKVMKQIIFIEVDQDRSRGAAAQFDIDEIPVLLKLDADGDVQSSHQGLASPDEFIEFATGKLARRVMPVGEVDIGDPNAGPKTALEEDEDNQDGD